MMYTRHFLNDKEDIALIQVSCKTRNDYCEADFILTDCYRRVEIELGFNKSDKRSRIRKLNRIINTLTKLRDEMEKADLKKR